MTSEERNNGRFGVRGCRGGRVGEYGDWRGWKAPWCFEGGD